MINNERWHTASTVLCQQAHISDGGPLYGHYLYRRHGELSEEYN